MAFGDGFGTSVYGYVDYTTDLVITSTCTINKNVVLTCTLNKSVVLTSQVKT